MAFREDIGAALRAATDRNSQTSGLDSMAASSNPILSILGRSIRGVNRFDQRMDDAMASAGSRITSRIIDMLTGNRAPAAPPSTPGARLPAYLTRQYLDAPDGESTPQWGTPAPRTENTLYGEGQGMMRGGPVAPVRNYQGNRAGTRGTTIAEGQDAQDMAQGFQDAAKAEYMANLARQARARMDSIQK